MRLELTRQEIINDATIGTLTIDGRWFCWTLEDRVRAQKIRARTAIPAGEYNVAVTMSARFKQMMPLVMDVPEFSGIRIHPGNSIADTEGCILVGFVRDGDRILNSRQAFDELMRRMAEAKGEGIFLTIRQPADWPKWNERVTMDLTQAAPAVSAGATGNLSAPQIPPAAAPVVLPRQVSTPDDPPIAVTQNGGRVWMVTLFSWFAALPSSVWTYLKGDAQMTRNILLVVGGITALYFLRGIVTDGLRLYFGSRPDRFNVK
jgi:hypothetical protein